MLTILTGRAGTGKTKHIMLEIERRMRSGEKGMLLIVPEQYSHEAERQLCAVCGDALSLYAEVLSFTRLCRRVFDETGGMHGQILDKSGQILLMHKAIEEAMPGLKVFTARKTRMQLPVNMLAVINELRGMCATPAQLRQLAVKATGPLSDKLSDFALIMETYNALISRFGEDTAGRLDALAGKIADSTAGEQGHIYFDGFTDFTAQETRVIKALLDKGADITVCLTCGAGADGTGAQDNDEIFGLPRAAASQLAGLADDVRYTSIDGKDTQQEEKRDEALIHLEKYLFDDITKPYGKKTDAITIYAAPSQYTGCEYAAAAIWELVRSGHRWREIGVMARDFNAYEPICGHVFDKYAIPYFTSGRADIQNKPPAALIDAALEIAISGWEYRPVFRYLKTGLLKYTADETAMLENYVQMWGIRGSMWLRGWTMPPSGYASGNTGSRQKAADAETLRELNKLREEITAPLIVLREAVKGEGTAQQKLAGLQTFLEQINFYASLAGKAERFFRLGELRTGDEYLQMSDIIINALEQMYTVLGESALTADEFRKLTQLVLAQYDVGVIPVTLDAVPLGSMPMSRRRDLKCLIILGADDENMPYLGGSSGILSDSERRIISQLDNSIGAGFSRRIEREMNMIYQTLTLPSEKLIMIYDTSAGAGASFIVKKLCRMYDIGEMSPDRQQYMSTAQIPYSELLYSLNPDGEEHRREHLSAAAAQQLYGKNPVLSATRADSYYSCPYKHFLQTGLKLGPLRKADFDAMAAGLYMHYVLESVFTEITAGRKLNGIDDAEIEQMTRKYSQRYAEDVLLSFEGKNTRFKYLFRHYEDSVIHVALDMARELKCSQFVPAYFELDLSEISQTQRGYIDRVDVYESGGRLYYRIIDYKTRRKAYEFNLGSVLHGRDMQMLIYLFALEKYGSKITGKEMTPAGVLYIPARDLILSAGRNIYGHELEELRAKDMRRSGLIIDNPAIIEAMETGEDKKYLPVKTKKDGALTGDSLVSSDRLKLLSGFIDGKLAEAKKAIENGINDCTPYYRDINDNACAYCDYHAVCAFDEKSGDKLKYARKMTVKEVWETLEQGTGQGAM